MRYLWTLTLAIIASFYGYKSDAGFNDPMEFYLATSGGNCATCTWITAEGVIGPETFKDFEEFLAREDLVDVRGLNIHLNSPGGNLYGGVSLGLSIRAIQANTVVSAARIEQIYDSGIRVVSNGKPSENECSSACVFAFAGGVSRFASITTPGAAFGFQEIGRLGVHQFYSASALANPTLESFSAEDRIHDQRTISMLLAYLSEMGVSAELLQLAARTDPRDMHYLTEGELRRTVIDNRMVRDFFLTGYRNGVAITEITYSRLDGDYRLEVYCDGGEMRMLASIDWRGFYDIDGHRRWNLFDGISLINGGPVELISEQFKRRSDGGVTGQLLFRFADQLPELVGRKRFAFEDWSSRYANNSAVSMSFTLPEDFDGLFLLPRTCL